MKNKIKFYVEWEDSPFLLPSWCDTMEEAKKLADEFPNAKATIFIHVPVTRTYRGKPESLI